MDNLLALDLPLVGNVKESDIPSPEEYTYWHLRNKRTFVIDYEVDENYELIELSKIIIQMNMDEMDIPKEKLKPIYIWVHSFGGDMQQQRFFSDLLISSRIPIVTIAMGVAMSAGFLIFLAGHKRYAFQHSKLLVHDGYAGFEGTASEMEEFNKNYKKMITEMKDYVLSRTSIDEKTFNKFKNKDWYLTSEELVKYDVVDKLIENIEEVFQ